MFDPVLTLPRFLFDLAFLSIALPKPDGVITLIGEAIADMAGLDVADVARKVLDAAVLSGPNLGVFLAEMRGVISPDAGTGCNGVADGGRAKSSRPAS